MKIRSIVEISLSPELFLAFLSSIQSLLLHSPLQGVHL